MIRSTGFWFCSKTCISIFSRTRLFILKSAQFNLNFVDLTFWLRNFVLRISFFLFPITTLILTYVTLDLNFQTKAHMNHTHHRSTHFTVPHTHPRTHPHAQHHSHTYPHLLVALSPSTSASPSHTPSRATSLSHLPSPAACTLTIIVDSHPQPPPHPHAHPHPPCSTPSP